jgi:hypothetical protein
VNCAKRVHHGEPQPYDFGFREVVRYATQPALANFPKLDTFALARFDI